MRPRTGKTVGGNRGVDYLRVGIGEVYGRETQRFQVAGLAIFEQNVCALDETQKPFAALLRFDIQDNRFFPSVVGPMGEAEVQVRVIGHIGS